MIQAAEAEMFSQLDYSSHDQRAYGYPYPIKACHDRVRLSMAERSALKKTNHRGSCGSRYEASPLPRCIRHHRSCLIPQIPPLKS
jgi:hypothetical protein